jgi:hypothetical protein
VGLRGAGLIRLRKKHEATSRPQRGLKPLRLSDLREREIVIRDWAGAGTVESSTADKRLQGNTWPIRGEGRDCALTCSLELARGGKIKSKRAAVEPQSGRWEMELSIELGRVQVRVGKGVKGRANPRDLRQAFEQTAVAKITAVEMHIWKFFFYCNPNFFEPHLQACTTPPQTLRCLPRTRRTSLGTPMTLTNGR